MAEFNGFPAGELRFTSVPDLFFARLLPRIDSLVELKVTLHFLWVHYRQARQVISFNELLTDETLMQSLALIDDEVETALSQGLNRAVERGTLLHAQIEAEIGRQDLYFLNSERGRQAQTKIETGEVGARTVTQVFRRQSDHLRLLDLRSSDGTEQRIETTDEHPFWAVGRGWVEAGELAVGEKLEQSAENWATVVSTTRRDEPAGIPVYNIEVDGVHTYYVAAHGTRAPPVLVHNCNPRPKPKGICFLAGTPIVVAHDGSSTPIGVPPVATLTPIEHIRVGQRVLADDPHVEACAETAVDPATWKKLTLHAVWIWEDGTRDEVNVATLQPPKWLMLHHVRVGATVPLPLDLIEMGLPESLVARVVAVEPCPAVLPRSGRVVLTTVNHLNNDVRALTVRDAFGDLATVCPTGFHKFYSPTQNEWISTNSLMAGEGILARDGELIVASNRRLPGVHRVYNLTVEGEHVYYVSRLAALAHNNDCAQPGGNYERPSEYRKGVRDQVWDDAIEDATGQVRDPASGRFMSKDEPWDMGHRPGHEFRKHQQSAAQRGITRDQFLDEYNDPSQYRPELPSSNQSHLGEDLTDDYFGP